MYKILNGTETYQGNVCNKWLIQNALEVRSYYITENDCMPSPFLSSSSSSFQIDSITHSSGVCLGVGWQQRQEQASKLDALRSRPRVPVRSCAITLTSTDCIGRELDYDNFKFKVPEGVFDLPSCCNNSRWVGNDDLYSAAELGMYV